LKCSFGIIKIFATSTTFGSERLMKQSYFLPSKENTVIGHMHEGKIVGNTPIKPLASFSFLKLGSPPSKSILIFKEGSPTFSKTRQFFSKRFPIFVFFTGALCLWLGWSVGRKNQKTLVSFYTITTKYRLKNTKIFIQ